MGSISKCERELERCIDLLVEDMNVLYCADLNEYAKVEAKMSDIKLRDELIRQIKEVIRCKKISERIMAEQLTKKIYEVKVRISSEDLSYTLSCLD